LRRIGLSSTITAVITLLVPEHVVKPVPVLAWTEILKYLDTELATFSELVALFILIDDDKALIVSLAPE
jgi:hypothetical protein